MLGKIHLGFTFASIVFFLLPWTEIRCSGEQKRLAIQQSGLEIIYGGATVHGPEGRDRRWQTDKEKDSLGVSPLLAVALVASLGAFAASLASFRAGVATPSKRSNALCALALALILTQLAIGFPVERKIAAESKSSDLVTWSVHYLPSLYLELACLAFPTLLFANGLLDKLRPKPAQAE